MPGDVGELVADPRAGDGAADLGGRRAGGVVLLFLSPVGSLARLGLGDLRLGAVGDAGELGDDAGGQDEGEAAHVLFAVSAGQAHEEGRVGAGLVVQGAGFEARVEGGGARGAGAAADAAVDREGGLRARPLRRGRGCRGPAADQGVKRAMVSKVPQPGGVISGLRPPSRKWNLKEEKGSWGTS